MPFSQDPGVREHEYYCSYCYKNGELTYKGDDLHAFQKLWYVRMRQNGMSRWRAKFSAWMIRFAPHWKREKRLFVGPVNTYH
ncbi:MAG: hypothetical protein KC877_01815 [Candidatus Kaiserbacteria bacterium]|nr:hypothetical protein [Candidatus Kaiserbacteria bacterium]MCB9815913.1 hypothetical protein [Candidatus Nomurabacteria bacterium]